MLDLGVPPNRRRRRSLFAGHHVPIDEPRAQSFTLDGSSDHRIERGTPLFRQHKPAARVPLDQTPDHQHRDCRPGHPSPLPFRPTATQKSKMRSGVESSEWTASSRLLMRPKKHVAPRRRRSNILRGGGHRGGTDGSTREPFRGILTTPPAVGEPLFGSRPIAPATRSSEPRTRSSGRHSIIPSDVTHHDARRIPPYRVVAARGEGGLPQRLLPFSCRTKNIRNVGRTWRRRRDRQSDAGPTINVHARSAKSFCASSRRLGAARQHERSARVRHQCAAARCPRRGVAERCPQITLAAN
jgi:hypothetical protein